MTDNKNNYEKYSTLNNISMNSRALRGFVDAVNSITELSKEIAQQDNQPDGKYVCAKLKSKT